MNKKIVKKKKDPSSHKKNKASNQFVKKADKALVKYDPLQRYLAEISNYNLLTREQEKEYGIGVQEHGDKQAAYALVTSNLRLVVKIALDFQRVWMQNLLDLIQEGNIGLIHAVRKFDPYKNVKFSYYASFWIKAYILKFIMDNWRLVKIGTTQGQRKLFFKLNRAKKKLQTISQRNPEFKEIAEMLNVKEREIEEMELRLNNRDVSLNAAIDDEGESTYIDHLVYKGKSQEDALIKKEEMALVKRNIAGALEKLNEREGYIIRHRIMADDPETLQEIGNRFHITRERARQIEKDALKKMRVAIPYLTDEPRLIAN